MIGGFRWLAVKIVRACIGRNDLGWVSILALILQEPHNGVDRANIDPEGGRFSHCQPFLVSLVLECFDRACV